VDLYPAVDVRGGRVARVPPGLPDDPLAAARAWAAAGARWVHFVDLDRAFAEGDNRMLARTLLHDAGLRVQVGGGLSEPRAIAEMLDWGAARVVVGAHAAANSALLSRLVADHGAGRLAVAIEGREGRVVPRGRTALPAPDLSVAALAQLAAASGIETAVYTDVTRDGGLTGPDVEGARALSATTGLAVILSGGVASLDDLTRARAAGLAGAVVGRALYDGRFTLEQALACLAG
jgi:phosphoribosylformimino-5-aminoimidazole carboxamide ribonucleotide (ProFAR) isomerase